MQVNMLEAKNQLSKLVKAAVAGEEVIIASHGKAQVRLVPCEVESGLRTPGGLRAALGVEPQSCESAFSDLVDQQVRDVLGA